METRTAIFLFYSFSIIFPAIILVLYRKPIARIFSGEKKKKKKDDRNKDDHFRKIMEIATEEKRRELNKLLAQREALKKEQENLERKKEMKERDEKCVGRGDEEVVFSYVVSNGKMIPIGI